MADALSHFPAPKQAPPSSSMWMLNTSSSATRRHRGGFLTYHIQESHHWMAGQAPRATRYAEALLELPWWAKCYVTLNPLQVCDKILWKLHESHLRFIKTQLKARNCVLGNWQGPMETEFCGTPSLYLGGVWATMRCLACSRKFMFTANNPVLISVICTFIAKNHVLNWFSVPREEMRKYCGVVNLQQVQSHDK